MTKKTYSIEFKRAVATEAIKGKKSVSQIASDFGIHPTLVRNWRQSLNDMDSPENDLPKLLSLDSKILARDVLTDGIIKAKELIENIFIDETDEELQLLIQKAYRYLLDAEILADVTDQYSLKKVISTSQTNIGEHLKQEARELGHQSLAEYLANLNQSFESFSNALITEYCFFNANHEFEEYLFESARRSSLASDLREAFNRAEEALSIKSILFGIVPPSHTTTYLDPSDRFIGPKKLLNCKITLEFETETKLTKREEISIIKAVDVFLKSTEYLDFDLLELFGYDKELSFDISTEITS